MPLVGRDHELSRLRVAVAGRRGFLGLTGDAGMGKSRLLDALCGEGLAAGARVATGRCWEAGGAPAFWPWVEVLRALVRDGRPAGLDAVASARLAHLVPEVAERAADAAGASPAAFEPRDDAARFALFDAVASLLRLAAGERPLLVVLDDVHVADEPSLLLLRFAVQTLGDADVLIAAAWRDREAGPLLAGLPGERLPLGGLGEDEVAALLRGRGVAPAPGIAARLRAATDGNPLFVDEAARLLAADGALPARLPLPARVGEAIGRRIAALPEATAALLGAAAVIGREFTLPVLTAAAGEADALAVLDPAIAAELVEPSVGRLRFSHVLVRDALYAGLPASRRVALHAAVADALEALGPGDAGERLSELAHHRLQAATDEAGAARAVAAAERAAARALRLLAFEDAAELYEAALACEPAAAVRARLLLGLGDARRRAGDAAAARAAFVRAARCADETAASSFAAETRARAALGVGELMTAAGEVDAELVALLEGALRALPPEDGVLRSRVLGRLARELHFAGVPERRAALADEAIAMAERIGDPATLAAALGAWHIAEWWPGNPEQRLAVADRVLALAEEAGDDELRFQVHVWRLGDLLELGDFAGVDRELAACEALAERLGQPAWLAQVTLFKAMRAIHDGRFDEGEELSVLAYERGVRARGSTAWTYRLVHRYQRALALGGLEALEPDIRHAGAVWRGGHVHVLAAIGSPEARPALERLAADGFGEPRTTTQLSVLNAAAEAAVLLGDTRIARDLYDRLLPHAHRWVVAGVAGGVSGVVARQLGALAALLGRHDEAVAHFEAAIPALEAAGARPHLERARAAYARMEEERDDARVAAGAAAPPSPGGASAALSSGAATPTAAAGAATPPSPGGAMLREGEYWTLVWQGRTVRVADGKGLQHLARLLASPRREIPALELAGVAAGTAGEHLDARARRDYRARVAELQEELEEATRFHDPERAERAREELGFVAAELRRAVGLGGRTRHAGSGAERARLNVTRAIRAAIRRIAEIDATLGAHLDEAVRTGAECRYAADAAWRVAG